jgi:hypothetical protein
MRKYHYSTKEASKRFQLTRKCFLTLLCFGLIKHFISFYICFFGKINEETQWEVNVDEEDKERYCC